jgi:hypothetical protein
MAVESESTFDLTSTQLSELTGVTPQSINNLRKEKVLPAVRPAGARAKRSGFLYRKTDASLLVQASLLGMEKTFVHSAKIVQKKEKITSQATGLLELLSAIAETVHSQEEGNIDRLLSLLATHIQGIDSLHDEEMSLLISLIEGNFPLTDDGDENTYNRRTLDHAKVKIADLLFTFVRLVATEKGDTGLETE